MDEPDLGPLEEGGNKQQSSWLEDINTQKAIVGVNLMTHIAVTKDLQPLAKKLNVKHRSLEKYQLAVEIAEELISKGYVDVKSSDGQVSANFIQLKRE